MPAGRFFGHSDGLTNLSKRKFFLAAKQKNNSLHFGQRCDGGFNARVPFGIFLSLPRQFRIER